MAKKVIANIKLQIKAGKATPSPEFTCLFKVTKPCLYIKQEEGTFPLYALTFIDKSGDLRRHMSVT